MHKMKFRFPKLLLGCLALVLGMSLGACVAPSGDAKAAPQPVPAAAAPAPKVEEPKDIYEATIQPLTPADCARCHTKQFGGLKAQGGKHKFDCQKCHQEFHAYNPLRNNYADIMPKCASCHTTPPHGEKHKECLGCHVNPHTPRNVPYTSKVTGLCAECHGGPAGQLKQFPSKHTLQDCKTCHHDRHGYIPKCFECHEPHFKEQKVETCTSCHPVHKPLQITFKSDVEVKTCNACHDTVYGQWSKTPSKHGKVSCVTCHTKHGLIPKCNDCHGQPHSASLHKSFPNCLTCHINPHDLPVKKK